MRGTITYNVFGADEDELRRLRQAGHEFFSGLAAVSSSGVKTEAEAAQPSMQSEHYPPRVVRLVDQWRPRILPGWRVVLMPDPFSELDTGPRGPQGQTQSDSEYRVLRLWINLESVDQRQERTRDRVLEETIVHELLHGLLDEIEDVYSETLDRLSSDSRDAIRFNARLARERVTESLARLLVATRYGEVPYLVVDGPHGHAR